MSSALSRNGLRPFITTAITLCIAGYLISICIAGLKKPFVEDGWQVTQGVILDPKIKLSGKLNEQRRTEGFEQTINYEYTVNDVSYRSNSVSEQAYVNPEEYPEGKTVDVYVHPDDPTRSVLVRTPTQKAYLYAMMLFCIILGGVTLFKFFNLIKRS